MRHQEAQLNRQLYVHVDWGSLKGGDVFVFGSGWHIDRISSCGAG